jgi:hypothetical protein
MRDMDESRGQRRKAAPEPLSLRILESIEEVPRETWNALAGEGAVPFLRWEWIHAMEASGSASERMGWGPHHLTLWRGQTLVGAAPAYLKTHSMGEYVYDFSWAHAAQQLGVEYYPKLLVGVPLSPITAPRLLVADGEPKDQVRQALLEGLLETARESGCSSVHIIFPPEAEALELEERGLARRTGMQYHWQNPGYGSYEDYLSRFDSKRRNQLRRERGAAEKQGIHIATVKGAELTREHADLAYRFYEATNRTHSWGRIQLNRDFFRRVFEALPDMVELVLATKEGKPIAGAFNLATKDRLFGRYWGAFEDHPFLHFNVCLYHSVDDCIRRGIKVFEPGAGGEHKISRGFVPTAIHSAHQIFDKRLDRAVRDFVVRERVEMQQILDTAEEVAGMRPFGKPEK